MPVLTPNKKLSLPAVGGDVGAWGSQINTDLSIIDTALAGALPITLSNADYTITAAQAQNLVIVLNGTINKTIGLYLPPNNGQYIIFNNTAGPYNIYASVSGGAGTSSPLPQNHATTVYCDTNNVLTISSSYQPYWRMYSPSVALPSNGTTDVGNYAASESYCIDNTVDRITGKVTIGPTDAGLYQLMTTCSGYGSNESVAVFIARNGLQIAASAYPANTSPAPAYISTSVILRLNYGDVVKPQFLQINSAGSQDSTIFSVVNHFSGIRIAT